MEWKCNTLNLGYKISFLISTKFRCYLRFSLFFAPLFISSQVIGNVTSNIVANKTLYGLLLMYHAGKYIFIDEFIGCALA
jgi:hypothetical protein